MNVVEQLVSDHLGLAQVIARDYANIPSSTLEEITAHATTALLAAARGYDSGKGDFTPFAVRSIRSRAVKCGVEKGARMAL